MALNNFPDSIYVKLSSRWKNVNATRFNLHRVPGQDVWTVEGNDVPSIYNFLKFAPFSSGGKVGVRLQVATTGTTYGVWTPSTLSAGSNSVTDTQADYTFRELFLAGTGLTSGHNTWGGIQNYLTDTSGITFNPLIFDILEEALIGNNMPEWNDRLMVTLGSAFSGGGFGLNENDKLTLKKVASDESPEGAGSAPYFWTEDGTTTPSPSNRLKFAPEQGGIPNIFNRVRASFYVLSSSGSSWASTGYASISVYGTGAAGQPYERFDIFNYPPLPTWATTYSRNTVTGTGGGSFSWTSSMKYNPDIFKTMEFMLSDKTTYRYG
jgi:hypothetical protein